MEADVSGPSTRSTLGRQVDGPSGASNPLVVQLVQCLNLWQANSLTPGYSAIRCLEELAVLLEKATTDFHNLNPDPLDDRHPIRTHPNAILGIMIKSIVRKEDFISRLVSSYLLAHNNIPLNEAAARVLLSCVPGLDSNIVFSVHIVTLVEEPEEFVPQLYQWARGSESDLLKAYSMGLLGSAMEVSDNAGTYRHYNMELIPIGLQRLKHLKDEMDKEKLAEAESSNSGESAEGCAEAVEAVVSSLTPETDALVMVDAMGEVPENGLRVRKRAVPSEGERMASPPRKKKREEHVLRPLSPPRSVSPAASNSQWNIESKVIIGTHKIYPLTTKMHQRLILQYLGPIGEYQDLVAQNFEGNALSLLLDYIHLEYTQDIRLTFDALRYLCSLLVHRRFAFEFVTRGGVEALIKIPCNSLASVGVATCFYYLSYAPDVMEKVCQLREEVIDGVVEYALFVMEHSHESGMASAAMFLTYALYFRAILDRFDARDGLRKLYNYISTLTLLQEPPSDMDLTEEQMQTSTQSVRNACSALRSYAAAHVYMRMQQSRRIPSLSTSKGSTPVRLPGPVINSLPSYKPMQLSEEDLREAVLALATVQRFSSLPWRPMEELYRLGFVKLLLSVLLKSHDWTSISYGRTEILRNVVQVVWMAAILPRVQKELCIPFSSQSDVTVGIGLMLAIVDGTMLAEPEVRLAAMNTLILCVCAPLDGDRSVRRLSLEKLRESRQQESPRELLETVWDTVRRNNGIMVLTSVIRSKPKTVASADLMRALTCRLLTGLARHPQVKQILLNLPLIAENELHELMKHPVCAEKKADHGRFCHEAKTLIAALTDKSLKDVKKDFTQEKLWKSHVVSSTQISYNEKELLQLIHSHLLAKGFQSTAGALAKEADLNTIGGASARDAPMPTVIAPMPSRKPDLCSHLRPSASIRADASVFSTPSGLRKKTASTPFPRRLQLKTPVRSESWTVDNGIGGRPTMQLDDIVKEYFRVQHSNCSTPMLTCPPFSLYHPHRCPEPTQSFFPNSVSVRNLRRALIPYSTQERILRMDERFAFSRFRQARLYNEHEEMYTTCAFSIDDEHIIVGMYSGEIHWVNLESGTDEAVMQCHHSSVFDINPSKDGSMLLTSGMFMPPLSTLWRLGDSQEHLMDFRDDNTVAFNNAPVQDRIVGGRPSQATIYDVESGRALRTFTNPFIGQHYRFDKATFSPSDELILHDSCLYDPRLSNPLVHSFDRLNEFTGGIFHPHGNEIIINSEIWDLRKFGLVQCVPELDQCKIVFNATGNVLIAAQRAKQKDPYTSQFTNTLRTFSSVDYSVLATIDTRKPIVDIALDHSDVSLAVIELTRSFPQSDFTAQRIDETACRLYEVGKTREPDEDVEEEAEDQQEEGDDGGDSSDDDSSSNSSSDSGSGFGGGGGALDYDVEDESEPDSDEDESEEDGDSDESSSGSSAGWETASNQGEERGEREGGEEVEEGVEREGEGERGGDQEEEDGSSSSSEIFMDDGSDAEDEEDAAYNPDVDERQGSSTIVLNPNLRRKRNAQPPP